MDQLAHELLKLRQRRGLTLDDLVDEAERLLPQVAERQTRYKVTERPDARTIRYYVTRGLLPRADGYEGGRARYGGAHLLRLLLVKKLQAEHHTLARIGATLQGADDRKVMTLLLGRDPSAMPEGAPAAGAATARSSAASEAPLSGQALQRIALPGGASLDLPSEVVSSSKAREALARALEAAAERLRHEERDESERGEPA